MSGLTLGPITFDDFEIPSFIDCGGRQRLVVHQLASGERYTEVMGPEEGLIRFDGVLSGPAAASRARELDVLRLSGGTLPLVWSEFFYEVIVADVRFHYGSDWWIPYHVACSVVRNPLAVLVTSVLAPLTQAAAALAAVPGDVPGLSVSLPSIGALISNSQTSSPSKQSLSAASADLMRIDGTLRAQGDDADRQIGDAMVSDGQGVDTFVAHFQVICDGMSNTVSVQEARDFMGEARVCVMEAAQP